MMKWVWHPIYILPPQIFQMFFRKERFLNIDGQKVQVISMINVHEFSYNSMKSSKNGGYNSWSTTVGHEKTTSALYVLWLHPSLVATVSNLGTHRSLNSKSICPFLQVEKKTLGGSPVRQVDSPVIEWFFPQRRTIVLLRVVNQPIQGTIIYFKGLWLGKRRLESINSWLVIC